MKAILGKMAGFDNTTRKSTMQQTAVAQAAHNILKQLRETYNGQPPRRAPAREADFRHLDLSAYRWFQSELETLGYRLLADEELIDMGRARGSLYTRTFVRQMVSADGCIVCSYYQEKQRLFKRLWRLFDGLMGGRGNRAREEFRSGQTIRHHMDVSSHYSDGRTLNLGNSQSAGSSINPPAIETHRLPEDTQLEELLDAHDLHMRQLLTETPGLRAVAVNSVEDLHQQQAREAALKAEYRKSVNWVTHEELLAMTGGNAEFADAVYEAIQQQLAKEGETE